MLSALTTNDSRVQPDYQTVTKQLYCQLRSPDHFLQNNLLNGYSYSQKETTDKLIKDLWHSLKSSCLCILKFPWTLVRADNI